MSSINPFDALRAAQRPVAKAEPRLRLLFAGATGQLGNEVLNRLVGGQRYELVQVTARAPYIEGLRGMQLMQVPGEEIAGWPSVSADVGVVMFDPPRAFYQRERALWTPQPEDLQALARWMHACGVRSLAVVLPHDVGSLPQALKKGLANLNEQAVAALGFERLIFVRSAKEATKARPGHILQRIAQAMLSAMSYMVPSNERPVRAMHVAKLVDAALQMAPAGIHVAPPDLVWRSAQPNGLAKELKDWLGAA